jgi:hypothetical protein
MPKIMLSGNKELPLQSPANKNKAKGRRKNYLINRSFQLSFLTHILVLALGVICIIYASNWYFFWKMTKMGISQGLPPDHIFFRFIQDQQIEMDWVFLSTALVVVALLCCFGLYYSHRIAGPLYRLQTYLKNLKGERPQHRLAFRSKDYFPEVAQSVNDYFEASKGTSSSSSE